MFLRCIAYVDSRLPIRWTAGNSDLHSCSFAFKQFYSKQSSNSTSAESLNEEVAETDNGKDYATSTDSTTLKPKFTQHIIKKTNSKKTSDDIVSNLAWSLHPSKGDSQRRWTTRSDISERLDKLKAATRTRKLDGRKRQVDQRYSDNQHFTTGDIKFTKMKKLRKINPAEIERCVKILSDQNERLNIFKKRSENPPAENIPSLEYKTALDWWNDLTGKSVANNFIQAPVNHYMEMLQWSEQGRLPLFPIDNEEGLNEEKDVPFYEHVFLDELLKEGFPKVGPVRKFMEAVVTGLSANPYLTVREKREHIDWFREYFSEKKETLATLGAIETGENEVQSNAND